MRYLFGSIVDWPALYKEAYRACAPGGWVESHEANARVESNNNSLPEDSALNEWTKFFIAGEEKLGRPFMIVDLDLQKKGMEEAGFVDIDVYDINVSPFVFSVFSLNISTFTPFPPSSHTSPTTQGSRPTFFVRVGQND